MLLATVDLETTGTEPHLHDVWEVGLVLFEFDSETESVGNPEMLEWRIRPDLTQATTPALRINGFYDRSPVNQRGEKWSDAGEASGMIARLTDARMMASCNVSFDIAFLHRFLIDNAWAPAWHYSPLDIKSLAYGRRRSLLGQSTSKLLKAYGVDVEMCLRYHSSRDRKLVRHSALGDAVLAYELLHQVMGWGSTYGFMPEPKYAYMED